MDRAFSNISSLIKFLFWLKGILWLKVKEIEELRTELRDLLRSPTWLVTEIEIKSLHYYTLMILLFPLSA